MSVGRLLDTTIEGLMSMGRENRRLRAENARLRDKRRRGCEDCAMANNRVKERDALLRAAHRKEQQLLRELRDKDQCIRSLETSLRAV